MIHTMLTYVTTNHLAQRILDYFTATVVALAHVASSFEKIDQPATSELNRAPSNKKDGFCE